MFAKQQIVRNFKGFLSCSSIKRKFSIRCLHQDFGSYSNILKDVMEYIGAGGPVKNSLNVDKGITTRYEYKPQFLYGKH